MPNTMLFSLLLNIGLLILIAMLPVKIPVVRSMFLSDDNPIGSHAALAVISGSVNTFSIYIGARTRGAIVNTRTIDVLAVELLGDPYAGMDTVTIGGLHCYLFDISGLTTVPCAISAFVEGLTGSVFSRRFKAGKIDSTGALLITALAEVGQMLAVILISKPFPAALELVQLITFLIITMNALGMVVFIITFNMVFMKGDSQLTEKMRLALGIVEQSLPHLKKGLCSTRDMGAMAGIIYNSTACAAVMITDTQRILVMKGDARCNDLKGDAILKPILDSIHNEKLTTFSYVEKPDPLHRILKNHIIVAAPLIGMDKPTGNLTMVARKHWHISQSNLSFISELARLPSIQLGLSDLDYQEQLRHKAEFKALQSQVNPYFFYNAPNTVPYMCWENPGRARELICTPFSYYRQTLGNDQYILSLHIELYHASGYLELEKARFEKRLQVAMDVEEDINCMVPFSILQPLVENTVRYEADKRGQRSVSISAHGTDNSVEITVTNKSPDSPMEAVKQLYSNEEKGSVNLKNVHRRLKSIYGENNGLKIESSQDGSRVQFGVLMQPEPDQGLLYS